MDQTHFRFFDWHTCTKVFEKSSLTVKKKDATGMFPQPLLRKLIPRFCEKLDTWMVRLFPGLFGMQFILIAEKSKAEK